MTLALLAAASIAAPVGAAWLHELTHAAVAWLLGGEVLEVDLLMLVVDFRFDPRAPRRERLVLLAPAIVGVTIGAIALLNWSQTITPWTVVGVLAWTVYTLNGGVQGELSLAPVTPDPSVDSR